VPPRLISIVSDGTKMKFNKYMFEMLESPWLRRQVETHLIFGPLSRSLSFGWILLFIFGIYFLTTFLGHLSAVDIAEGITRLFFVLIALFFLKMPRYHQAALGWCIIKSVLALVSFIMLIVGGLIGFLRGQPDAMHLTLLSLIWFPSLEFIPKLVENQKFITIGRIPLSIPIAYFGYLTGNWFWS
jgi:hypothetical protein